MPKLEAISAPSFGRRTVNMTFRWVRDVVVESEWMRLAVGSQGFDSCQGVHACESFCEEEWRWGRGFSGRCGVFGGLCS